jgi:hypothetical protein
MPPNRRRPGFFERIAGYGRRTQPIPRGFENRRDVTRHPSLAARGAKTAWNATKYAGNIGAYGARYFERRTNTNFISGEVARGRMMNEQEAEASYQRRVQEIEARNARAEEIENARRYRDPVFEKKVSDLATKILVKEIDRRRELRDLVKKVRTGRASAEERKAFDDLMGNVTKHAMKVLKKPIE